MRFHGSRGTRFARFRPALRWLGVLAAVGLAPMAIAGCSDESPIARLAEDEEEALPPPPERRRPRQARPTRPSYEAAEGGVPMLAVRESGFGAGDRAQRDQDRFVGRAADLSGWSAASVALEADPSAVGGRLEADGFHFGFLTASAYETLRADHEMDVLGEFSVRTGTRYYLVSTAHADVAGCRGQTVATNHAAASAAIDRAAAGVFQLSDFEVVSTEEGRDTLRALTYGKVECVLIVDGQLRGLQRRDEKKKLEVLWSSSATVPGVVVAFPAATEEERGALGPQLANICAGRGARVCESAGVTELRAASGPPPEAG